MRFSRAREALLFWWGYLQDGGVPLHPQSSNPHAERVQESLTYWEPDNLLCAYITVSKKLEQLKESDKQIIKSWLMDVIGTHEQTGKHNYNSWRYRNKFGGACLRLWNLLPKEMKRERRPRAYTKRGSIPSECKRTHGLQDATKRQTQGLQTWGWGESPMENPRVSP